MFFKSLICSPFYFTMAVCTPDLRCMLGSAQYFFLLFFFHPKQLRKFRDRCDLNSHNDFFSVKLVLNDRYLLSLFLNQCWKTAVAWRPEFVSFYILVSYFTPYLPFGKQPKISSWTVKVSVSESWNDVFSFHFWTQSKLRIFVFTVVILDPTYYILDFLQNLNTELQFPF